MHIISDDDPLFRQSVRHVGKALTVGNLAAVADSVAESRELFWKTEARLKADIADLAQRIDAVVASTKAVIADADRRDALRRGPR
jgi:hypothetical protein